MRELDLLVVKSINFLPDESIDILAVPFDVLVNFCDCVLTLNSFLVALVNESRKLLQFCALQESDIHHIDESPAVLDLLLRLIEIQIQLFK